MNLKELKKLQNEPKEVIEDTLESLCSTTETMSYTRQLTDEEYSKAKDDLAQTAIKQSIIQKEFDQIKEDFNAKSNPLKKKFAAQLEIIRTKSVQVEGDVYHIPNHETSMINYVSPDGIILSSRPMLPEERQLRISTQKSI